MTGDDARRSLQRQALRNGDLVRHMAAHLLVTVSEWAIFVGVLIYAFDRGGATATGFASIAMLAPYALSAPLTGALAQRYRPQRLRVFGASVQSLGYGVAALGAYGDVATPLVVAAAMVGIAGVTSLRPTGAMLLPALVRSSSELTVGNLWTGYAETTSALAGPAYATALLAVGGPSAVLAGCAAAAALAVVVTVVPRFVDPPGGSVVDDRTGALRLMRRTVATLRANPSMSSVLTVAGAQYFVVGALDIVIVVAAEERLGLGETGPGILLTVFGVGAVLSGVVTTVIVRRRRLGPALVTSMAATAALAAVMGLVLSLGAWLPLLALIGLSRATIDVLADVLLHRSAPAEELGGIFAVLELWTGFGLVAGSLVTQIVIAIGGVEAALFATSAFFVLLAGFSRSSLRSADDTADIPVVTMSLLRQVPMLAVLPRAELDGLARSAVEVDVAAGEPVITQGEPGDRYYAIADGRFDVTIDGRRIRTMERGAGFGEVALLGDVPRTATVTAATDGLLVAIDRSPFLVTMTGHDSARQAAWGLIRTLDGNLPIEDALVGDPASDGHEPGGDR